jgi:hypothetical protein
MFWRNLLPQFSLFYPEDGRSKIILNIGTYQLYYMHETKQVGLGVKIWTFIWKSCSSNLNWDTSYTDGFLWFSSVHPGRCQGSTSVRLQPLPSKSFPNYCSSIILPFDTISFWCSTSYSTISHATCIKILKFTLNFKSLMHYMFRPIW